ncbi:Transcriptional regulatory protein QseB [Rhodoplanes serenus]|uniref:Transcriptional regulatory protein QseB n=1 Tax=Rhodoplanes serenus TaxID=200615 RepID=A0A3S5CYF3_9BRAD|nr:response regulator transcription factor [Rhodoplanes serenus]MBI5114436.1 response regulator transcription factor [Rhodovulum sp.]VCU09402.1 Transcriptional regulatory protein QseB [Rhodoplanes serenus]
MRVLIVEDNEELARLVVGGLGKAGHAADHAATAAEARHILAVETYDAVVLDLGLPDADGLAIVREMRARQDPTAILVLTARAGVDDRVEGLRSGADDYLVKPFAFEELVARIEALSRRPRAMHGLVLRLANLSLDTTGRQAFIDDEPHILSARELAVLEILLRRKGRVVPKKLVEDQLFGASGDLSSNAVEVYVHRLRRQLAERNAHVTIHTVRGVGYMIAEAKA